MESRPVCADLKSGVTYIRNEEQGHKAEASRVARQRLLGLGYVLALALLGVLLQHCVLS